jgi:hypothetical protein
MQDGVRSYIGTDVEQVLVKHFRNTNISHHFSFEWPLHSSQYIPADIYRHASAKATHRIAKQFHSTRTWRILAGNMKGRGQLGERHTSIWEGDAQVKQSHNTPMEEQGGEKI